MKFVTHSFRIMITCLLLGVFIFGTTPAAAQAKSDTNIFETVDLSGIMRNSAGSNIIKNKYVTREEFAHMLVQASPYVGDIKTKKSARLFRDVNANSSNAPYIHLAVTKGYMSGYLGGKFKPKQAITVKEAAYGTLAVLGYTNNDFMNQLSGSRFEKFNELGLNKNIDGNEADRLTEADCENLFYNLLNAKQNSGVVYAVALGYAVNADGLIDYQALLEKKTKGPILIADGWKKQLSRTPLSYQILGSNNTRISSGLKDYSIIYYADQANKLWVYDKKIYGNLDNITYINGKPQELTVSGINYTVEKPEDMKKMIDEKDILKDNIVVLLLGRDDKVSYILPMQSRLAGGNWQQDLRFNITQGIIYRNGKVISPSEVKSSDVIYYSNELKTVWVYGKTTYGVITSISPTIAVPDFVNVAGVTYTLDSKPVHSEVGSTQSLRDISENEWGKRLRENGVQEGDNVIVYFGYDGKVAEICKVDKMTVTLSGYVLETMNKVVKNSNMEDGINRIVRIVETGGTILEFECSDVSVVKGTLVEVAFDSGKSVVKKIEAYTGNSISDLTKRNFAADARILEVKDGNYTKIKVADIKELTWDAGNVLYCKLNSDGEIADLILGNVTHSFYQYGLLKKVEFPDYEKGIYSTQLTLDMGEELKLSPTNMNFDLNIGPKALHFENNNLKEMKNLQMVKLQYINGKQASSGSMVYRISDDVLVYYYENGEYVLGKFESLPINGNASIVGYVDDTKGPIHIIIVTK